MILMWVSEVFWEPEFDRPGERHVAVQPARPAATLGVAPASLPVVPIDLPQVTPESW